MKERPILILCLALMTVIVVLGMTGVPLLFLEGNVKEARVYAEREESVLLTGTVESFTVREEDAVLLLRNVRMMVPNTANSSLLAGTTEPTLTGANGTPAGDSTAVKEGTAGSVTLRLHCVRATMTPETYYKVGQTVQLTGTIRNPPEATNPGQFDSALYYHLKRIDFLMYKPEAKPLSSKYYLLGEGMASLRRLLLSTLRKTFPEDVEGPLAAMLLGNRSLLTDEDSLTFENGGASHMLVVSSLHLTILSTAVNEVLKRLKLSRRMAGGISLAVLLFFVALTGFSTSALRAVILFAFLMGAGWAGRSYDLWTALSFAAIVILTWNPYYLFYSSFHLSFAAVSLCALAKGKGAVGTTVILHLGMAPLTAYWFYKLPIFGIAVNLVLVPLLPAVLITGAVGLLAGLFLSKVPFFVAAAAFPATALLRFYQFILSGLSKIPNTVWITGRPGIAAMILYYVLFLLYLAWVFFYRNRPKKLFALLLIPPMLFLVGFRSLSENAFGLRTAVRIEAAESEASSAPQRKAGSVHDRLTLTFLDVGQGDGIVIRGPGGFSMLLDGGSTSVDSVGKYRILPYLESEGISYLTCIAVTHTDLDHISGIRELLNAMEQRATPIRAEALLLPELPGGDETADDLAEQAKRLQMRVFYLAKGDSITCGSLQIDVLRPGQVKEGITQKGEGDGEYEKNAGCLVLSVHFGTFDALLTGDVEGEGEAALYTALLEEETSYELLKVAHHGSRYTSSEAILQLIAPKTAVISVGRDSIYGHPHEEVLLRLFRICGEDGIFRTDKNGAVIVRTDGRKYTVHSFLT